VIIKEPIIRMGAVIRIGTTWRWGLTGHSCRRVFPCFDPRIIRGL